MVDVEGALSGLLGQNAISQLFLYNLIGQVIAAALTPGGIAITQGALADAPVSVLSPAEAASAVVRGFLSVADGEHESVRGGVDSQRFATLVRLAGMAPGPEQLAEALRRGIIPEDSGDPGRPGYIQGIREGNLANQWADMIRELAVNLPGPTLAVDAEVRGQLSHEAALDLYHRLGGDPSTYGVEYDTHGSPPSPLEAARMARRGLIPKDGIGAGQTTFQQAVAESGFKTKWTDTYWSLSEYFPPPRTVLAMIRSGALSATDGAAELTKAGLSPDMVAAYLHEASTTKVQAHKDLAVGTVTTLYRDQLITHEQATAFLGDLGYDATEAGFILSVEDIRVEQAQLSSSVSRVRSLYEARKIDRTTAQAALGRLQITGTQAGRLLNVWDVARTANVKHLTEAQIATALHYQVITQDDAISYLVGQGYSAYEAWILVSSREHGPLPNQPPKTFVGSAQG